MRLPQVPHFCAGFVGGWALVGLGLPMAVKPCDATSNDLTFDYVLPALYLCTYEGVNSNNKVL